MNVTATKIAKEFGFTARHWTRQAVAGNIPGAYQPSGPGGHWLFDVAVFRRWMATRQREVDTWRGLRFGRCSMMNFFSASWIYRRGATWWGRVQRQGKDLRQSLDTRDRRIAEKRLRQWLDEMDAVAWGEKPRRIFDRQRQALRGQHQTPAPGR